MPKITPAQISVMVYSYSVEMLTQEDLQTRFTYHAPKGNQGERYEAIRDKGKDMAELLCRMAPESRELSLAITHLEEAVMWANAAIARREP